VIGVKIGVNVAKIGVGVVNTGVLVGTAGVSVGPPGVGVVGSGVGEAGGGVGEPAKRVGGGVVGVRVVGVGNIPPGVTVAIGVGVAGTGAGLVTALDVRRQPKRQTQRRIPSLAPIDRTSVLRLERAVRTARPAPVDQYGAQYPPSVAHATRRITQCGYGKRTRTRTNLNGRAKGRENRDTAKKERRGANTR
jgi:hypothetical protein